MEKSGHMVEVEKETLCLTGGPSTFLLSRPEQVQASLGLPEQCMGELKSTESATSPSRLPLASSHEHQDGGKPCEVS